MKSRFVILALGFGILTDLATAANQLPLEPPSTPGQVTKLLRQKPLPPQKDTHYATLQHWFEELSGLATLEELSGAWIGRCFDLKKPGYSIPALLVAYEEDVGPGLKPVKHLLSQPRPGLFKEVNDFSFGAQDEDYLADVKRSVSAGFITVPVSKLGDLGWIRYDSNAGIPTTTASEGFLIRSFDDYFIVEHSVLKASTHFYSPGLFRYETYEEGPYLYCYYYKNVLPAPSPMVP